MIRLSARLFHLIKCIGHKRLCTAEATAVPVQNMSTELPYVSYLYCGAPFYGSNGSLDPNIIPDGQHLDAAGMEMLATCMQPVVDALVRPHKSHGQCAIRDVLWSEQCLV